VHDAQLRAPSGQVLAAALVDRRDNPIRRGPEEWWIEAAFLAFGKIRTEEQRKRSHHAPVNVTPFVVSAGGGSMEVTDALLPSAKGRSGRHYERLHLSGTLLKYWHRLAAEFVSHCCARAGVAFDRGTA
jgi:hypothetical protein